MLKDKFEWYTENAFLELHGYEILQKLLDQGTIFLGNDQIKVQTLSDEISRIVDKLIECRCYALALDLNERVKLLYTRKYDLERI